MEEMLEGWHDLLPQYMQRWQLDRQHLVDVFGATRDEWIAADLEGWLAPNRIYPGVADAVKGLMLTQEVYIVTTKQVPSAWKARSTIFFFGGGVFLKGTFLGIISPSFLPSAVTLNVRQAGLASCA